MSAVWPSLRAAAICDPSGDQAGNVKAPSEAVARTLDVPAASTRDKEPSLPSTTTAPVVPIGPSCGVGVAAGGVLGAADAVADDEGAANGVAAAPDATGGAGAMVAALGVGAVEPQAASD